MEYPSQISQIDAAAIETLSRRHMVNAFGCLWFHTTAAERRRECGRN